MDATKTETVGLAEYLGMLEKAAHDGTFPGKDGRGCQYRTASGRRCAVGLLIKDGKYDPVMEGGICRLYENWPDRVRGVEGLSLQDLRQVQTVHDHYAAIGWDTDAFLAAVRAMTVFQGVEPVKC